MPASSLSLRNAVAGLTNQASRDLSGLWRSVDSAVMAGTALRDILPALVDQYGAAATVLATEWYDDARDLAGVSGRFGAIPAVIPESGTQALIGWAISEATDYAAFQALILGGTQRRIADFARETVAGSSIADPRAHGWVRVGSGGCDWCSQYLDGEVRSVAYDFPAHDNCNCSAAPAW